MELTGEGGPPLGTVEDFQYPVERHQLTPGDLLLLYTDGVTEAENSDDAFYTAARLELLLRSAPTASAKALVEFVREDIRRFAAGAEQADDITLLAVRWTSAARRDRRESTDSDLDPAIARFGYLRAGRHGRIQIAAPGDGNRIGVESVVYQPIPNCVRALERELLIVRLVAERVGISDDLDLVHRTPLDVVEDIADIAAATPASAYQCLSRNRDENGWAESAARPARCRKSAGPAANRLVVAATLPPFSSLAA